MPFSLELTDAQAALREKVHTFARDVIRPAPLRAPANTDPLDQRMEAPR